MFAAFHISSTGGRDDVRQPLAAELGLPGEPFQPLRAELLVGLLEARGRRDHAAFEPLRALAVAAAS